MNVSCKLCHRILEYHKLERSDMYDYCRCKNCGNFKIPNQDYKIMSHKEYQYLFINKHLISGLCREITAKNSDNVEFLEVSQKTFPSLLKNSLIPSKLIGKMDKILYYIYKNTKFFGKNVEVPFHPAIGYAKDGREFINMLKTLKELELIDRVGKYYRLTLKGISKTEKMDHISKISDKAFVAMWFDKDILNVFNDYISSAITEAGYKPFIIPLKEYNDNITDHIIAEIRNSKFLIADFTGQRGGVYFEAGFAYGLGLQVIYTCREDWFDKTVGKKVPAVLNSGEEEMVTIKEKRYTHFDINHYNFILWKDGPDLYSKLLNRIKATIV